MIWRSTKLGKVERHCLAVLCFEESEDRRVYEVGKVAHFVMEQAQVATNTAGVLLGPGEIRTVAEAAMAATAEHGFVWEGRPEPPPRPDAAIRGRRLAETWLLDNPPEPGFLAEVAVTLDRWGKRVDKTDPAAKYRMILDRAGLQQAEVDDSVYTALVLGDTKSDWQSGSKRDDEGVEVSLNNAQRRLQALGGWELFADEQFSAMHLEIYSLPRRWTYRRILAFDEMGILDEWREELNALTDAYDRRIDRHGLDPEKLASPGVGCKGCPHLGECRPGRRHLKVRLAGAPPEAMAAAYAAGMAETWRLRPYLASLCDEEGSIRFGDTEVGYVEKVETVVAPNAAEIVWKRWKLEHLAKDTVQGSIDEMAEQLDLDGEIGALGAHDAFERDLLQSYLDGLRLGKTELEKLLRKLWPLNKGKAPERDAKRLIRDEIMAEATKTRIRPEFGIWKVKPPEPSLEDQLRASLEDR